MKKLDIAIISGLILSLVIILSLRLEDVSNQNQLVLQNQELIKNNSRYAYVAASSAVTAANTIIENQRLIKQALNLSIENAQDIQENQITIQRLANIINTNTDSNRNMTIENRAMISALNSTFNRGFAENVTTRQVQTLSTSNQTLSNTDEILNLLSKTPPIRSGPT